MSVRKAGQFVFPLTQEILLILPGTNTVLVGAKFASMMASVVSNLLDLCIDGTVASALVSISHRRVDAMGPEWSVKGGIIDARLGIGSNRCLVPVELNIKKTDRVAADLVKAADVCVRIRN